jgi:hypothetical protein
MAQKYSSQRDQIQKLIIIVKLLKLYIIIKFIFLLKNKLGPPMPPEPLDKLFADPFRENYIDFFKLFI